MVEIARCLLQAKDLSTKVWSRAIYYENYLLKWILTRVVYHLTPIKIWRVKKPSIEHLRMFGCASWEHISNDYIKKLDANIHACIMLGYSKESKAYWLFEPIKQQIIIRRNVIFDEKSSIIGLLNSSSSLLCSDPFDIVEDKELTIPFMGISTSFSTFVAK